MFRRKTFLINEITFSTVAFRNANCVGLNEALGSLPCKRISELNSLKIPLNLQNGQA